MSSIVGVTSIFVLCGAWLFIFILFRAHNTWRRWQAQYNSLQKVYLHWPVFTMDIHHTIPSKYSVVGTLCHRAKTICSSPQLLQEEEQHLLPSPKKCKYPPWVQHSVQGYDGLWTAELSSLSEPLNDNQWDTGLWFDWLVAVVCGVEGWRRCCHCWKHGELWKFFWEEWEG